MGRTEPDEMEWNGHSSNLDLSSNGKCEAKITQVDISRVQAETGEWKKCRVITNPLSHQLAHSK